MGCRGQIAIEQEEGDIYLYTHWRGDEIEDIVRKALKRGHERWDDPEYLARIVFDEMVNGDKDTTGYGIGLSIHSDLEYPVIRLCTDQTVLTENRKVSFENFCS